MKEQKHKSGDNLDQSFKHLYIKTNIYLNNSFVSLSLSSAPFNTDGQAASLHQIL